MANRKRTYDVVEVNGGFSVPFLKQVLGEKGRLATVNFDKKSDGSNRTLNGKTKAFTAMSGGEPAYDAESRGQLRVADVNVWKDGVRRTEYRTVTAANVKWITANGKKYVAWGAGEPEVAVISGIRHSINTGILGIFWSGKSLYHYFDVPRTVYMNLVDAVDKVQFFNDHIRGLYKYQKIS